MLDRVSTEPISISMEAAVFLILVFWRQIVMVAAVIVLGHLLVEYAWVIVGIAALCVMVLAYVTALRR